MKSITITAKIKLYPTSEQMLILNKTLSVIRDVLNFVSVFVFGQEGIRYLALDHALYYPVRQQFGLRSQMTQSVFKTVLAKYQSMKSNRHRYVMVSWAFSQFREMLEYKAVLSQSEVLAINPKYTSQSCPVCGNTTKANRNRKKHEFCCTICDYRSNDDRTGAINIYHKGCNTLFAEACQA